MVWSLGRYKILCYISFCTLSLVTSFSVGNCCYYSEVVLMGEVFSTIGCISVWSVDCVSCHRVYPVTSTVFLHLVIRSIVFMIITGSEHCCGGWWGTSVYGHNRGSRRTSWMVSRISNFFSPRFRRNQYEVIINNNLSTLALFPAWKRLRSTTHQGT